MTTTIEQNTEPQAANDLQSSRDVFEQVADLAAQCRTASVFYHELLNVYAGHFQTLYATMALANPSDSSDECFSVGDARAETWQRFTQAIMLESQTDGVAFAKLYDIDGTDARVAILAVPVRDERQYRGAIALVVRCRDRGEAERLLFELRSLTMLACSTISARPAASERAGDQADALSRAMTRAARFGSETELAFAITNGLKTKFQCDQVILGKVSRRRVRLLSLSGMDDLYPRSPGTRLIRQAMEECLDCGGTIHSKPGNEWSASNGKRDYRLHRQWRSAIGEAAVASVPLMADDQCVMVLSLVRPGNVGFQTDELEEIRQLASAYAPALQLVARASRGWFAQTRDSLFGSLRWLFAQNRWGRRMAAVAVVALVAWFCVGTWEYRLTVPCQLVPTELHHCTAPYQGIIRSAHVEVGDRVRKGQLLVALDTRDLELERAELRSEAAVLRLEVAQAVAREQVELAVHARARLEVVVARLSGVERRIEQALIRAPDDGTIMAGDVRRRVGEVVQLGEPLLEFAPHGAWAAELRIDSRDAQLVANGQTGRFVTIARPDQPVTCRIDRIDPVATVADGRTVYTARARITSDLTWSLAGMDGVATLDVGRRRIWWVVLHRAIDFVRLRFWI